MAISYVEGIGRQEIAAGEYFDRLYLASNYPSMEEFIEADPEGRKAYNDWIHAWDYYQALREDVS